MILFSTGGSHIPRIIPFAHTFRCVVVGCPRSCIAFRWVSSLKLHQTGKLSLNDTIRSWRTCQQLLFQWISILVKSVNTWFIICFFVFIFYIIVLSNQSCLIDSLRKRCLPLVNELALETASSFCRTGLIQWNTNITLSTKLSQRRFASYTNSNVS